MKRSPVVSLPKKQTRKLGLLVDLASDHQHSRFRTEVTLLCQHPQDIGKRLDKTQILTVWTSMIAKGSEKCRNLLKQYIYRTKKMEQKQTKRRRYIDKSGYRPHRITIMYYCPSPNNNVTSAFRGLMEHWNVFGRLRVILLRRKFEDWRALPYGPC